MKKLLNAVMVLFSVGVFLTGCSNSDDNDFFPDVSVSATSLIFQATVDAHQLQTVTVKNLNTKENVVLERITSTNEAFKIGGYFIDDKLVPLETPITIEGNGARTIYIAFYPAKAESYEGKLVVESLDSSDKPETDLVTLTGTGLPKPKEEEEKK